MKDTPMLADLKLVQVFLPNTNNGASGVYEVSYSETSNKYHCTCPGFSSRNTCKHVKFVKARVDSNDGKGYPLEISSRATSEDAEKAKRSTKDFREFIIKFGKVEVI